MELLELLPAAVPLVPEIIPATVVSDDVKGRLMVLFEIVMLSAVFFNWIPNPVVAVGFKARVKLLIFTKSAPSRVKMPWLVVPGEAKTVLLLPSKVMVLVAL